MTKNPVNRIELPFWLPSHFFRELIEKRSLIGFNAANVWAKGILQV